MNCRKRKIVTVDFSKAFDKVLRYRLFQKMIERKIPMIYKIWIHNNRSARVKINNELGRGRCIKEGVPQGGVLSPLLFLIFVNDLMVECSKAEVDTFMYADDLVMWTADKNKQTASNRLQDGLNMVEKWTKSCSGNIFF